MTIPAQKPTKIQVEYPKTDKNSKKLVCLAPKHVDFSMDRGFYGEPTFTLTWSGFTEVLTEKHPIDIDDNPCIVRGTD